MADTPERKIVFSGIQPTGTPTLGNYLGALRNWPLLQKDYSCIYSVVDMHSITVAQQPAQLRRRSLELTALLLSVGIDPARSLVFIQSHVPTHAQLMWVLNCCTQFGELSRMTQFKDKSRKHADNINAGLFTYPTLMAADILLYQTDLVPIGADQKQHLELARNIAERFNSRYGETFRLPEPYIPPNGARVMSLQDPTRKMSKSDENVNSFVLMLDDPDTVMRKFRRAVTDSESRVAFAPGKDGVNNLIGIYSALTGKTHEQIEAEFDGRGYGDFKTAVGEAAVETLRPIQQKYADLMKNRDYLETVYTEGGKRALAFSLRTLRKVYHKVGFLPSRL